MSKDTIYRQDAIDEANAWLLDCLGVQKQNRSCGLIRRLEDLPSADVQPVLQCKEGTMKLDTINWIEVHDFDHPNRLYVINPNNICEMHLDRTGSGEIFTWIKLVSGDDYFVVESLEEIIGATS